MPIPEPRSLRARAHEIIFEAETPAGRVFDIALMVAIVASVGAVMLESVTRVRLRYGAELRILAATERSAGPISGTKRADRGTHTRWHSPSAKSAFVLLASGAWQRSPWNNA